MEGIDEMGMGMGVVNRTKNVAAVSTFSLKPKGPKIHMVLVKLSCQKSHQPTSSLPPYTKYSLWS